MDLKAEFDQLREDIHVMQTTILSLANELRSIKQCKKPSVVETNAMDRYNNIVKTIRKWEMQFSGDRYEIMNAFLNKVEENCKLVGLSCNDLLPYLSLLFKGKASIWYHTYRAEWKTWLEFRKTANEWYGDDRKFQEALEDELVTRVQGRDEPVRDYLIYVTALMSKQRLLRDMSKDFQLDMMYRNMRHEIRERIRRDQFDSVSKLLRLAVDSEYCIELEKRYRSMPDLPFLKVKGVEVTPKKGANDKSEPNSASSSKEQSSAKTSKQDSTLAAKYDTVQRLDILYHHMKPSIKKKVRRDEIDSVSKLVELIVRRESGVNLDEDDISKDENLTPFEEQLHVDILYHFMVPFIKESVSRDKINSINQLIDMIVRAEIDRELKDKYIQDLNAKIAPLCMRQYYGEFK